MPASQDGWPAAMRRWLRSAIRYSVVTTAPKMNRPMATIMAVTWIAIQYDCRAGTSEPAGV